MRVTGPDVPADERALVTLSDAAYIDHHALNLRDAATWRAEQWARAMFEDDRMLLERIRDLGLLGALLSPSQPEGRVAGWTVVGSAASWLRMESSSRLTTDQVVVHVYPRGVSLTTAVRYERRGAQTVWRLVSTLHRRFAPIVLTRASRVLASSTAPGQN